MLHQRLRSIICPTTIRSDGNLTEASEVPLSEPSAFRLRGQDAEGLTTRWAGENEMPGICSGRRHCLAQNSKTGIPNRMRGLGPMRGAGFPLSFPSPAAWYGECGLHTRGQNCQATGEGAGPVKPGRGRAARVPPAQRRNVLRESLHTHPTTPKRETMTGTL